MVSLVLGRVSEFCVRYWHDGAANGVLDGTVAAYLGGLDERKTLPRHGSRGLRPSAGSSSF